MHKRKNGSQAVLRKGEFAEKHVLRVVEKKGAGADGRGRGELHEIAAESVST